ncbi:unnamed protein product [Gadus morhua 'NCC']
MTEQATTLVTFAYSKVVGGEPKVTPSHILGGAAQPRTQPPSRASFIIPEDRIKNEKAIPIPKSDPVDTSALSWGACGRARSRRNVYQRARLEVGIAAHKPPDPSEQGAKPQHGQQDPGKPSKSTEQQRVTPGWTAARGAGSDLEPGPGWTLDRQPASSLPSSPIGVHDGAEEESAAPKHRRKVPASGYRAASLLAMNHVSRHALPSYAATKLRHRYYKDTRIGSPRRPVPRRTSGSRRSGGKDGGFL